MKYSIIFLIFIFLFSCKESTQPEKTAIDYINEGWEHFTKKEYELALSSFQESINLDSTNIEGYNGAGWSSGKLDKFTESINYFRIGEKRSDRNYDIKGGLCFSLNAVKRYEESNEYGLKTQYSWIFSHDSTLNYLDIQLVLAQNYFQLQDFEKSLEYVQKLNPEFTCDITTYEGKKELANEIERLFSTI